MENVGVFEEADVPLQQTSGLTFPGLAVVIGRYVQEHIHNR
jgi:hypothetical protein